MNRVPWYEKRGDFTVGSILVRWLDGRCHPDGFRAPALIARVSLRAFSDAQFGR